MVDGLGAYEPTCIPLATPLNDNLRKGQKDPENFCPRWQKERSIHMMCEVSNCNEPVSRSTQLTRREVSKYLECSLDARSIDSNSMSTHLCDKHYRSLQKKIKPSKLSVEVCGMLYRHMGFQLFSL